MNQLLLAATPNWDLIIKVGSFILAIIGSGAAGIYKLLPAYQQNKKRADLKADLEILKGFKEIGLDYTIVAKRIAENAQDVYPNKETSLKKQKRIESYDLGMRIYGFFVFAGLAYWTYALYRNHHGFTAWMILTGFFSLGGLALLLGGYKDEKAGKKADAAVETAQAVQE